MPMMQTVRLEGSAESGYGVRLSGFHCPAFNAAKKLAELAFIGTRARLIRQCESNGQQTFLLCEDPPELINAPRKLATFRREPDKFFLDLDLFLKSLKAAAIYDMALSESHGALALTLLYVTADQDSGSSSA